MATLTKRGSKWRAEVRMKGVRKTKTCHNKAAAKAWAAKVETEIEECALGKIPDKTFGALLLRYADEVSHKKRSHKREIKAINIVLQDPISETPLREISGRDVAAWRDRRLQTVSGSTVNREWNILSHACTVAIKEWGWLHVSPTRNAQRPKENPPRTRRPSREETEKFIHVSGYKKDEPPLTKSARVGAAYLFAIETAMRAGEIAGITTEHIHERHVHLPVTKNGGTRDVPLSSTARHILTQVQAVTKGNKSVFGISTSTIDALFRKLRKKAGITGLHFHDTRREALTRLSKIYSVMELARISGHRDLRILQVVYYAPCIDDLADKLD